MNLVPSRSSGKLTSSQVLLQQKGFVSNLLIRTDGSNAATITFYDGLNDRGRIICDVAVAGASLFGGMGWEHPLICENGLYVGVSGTGASCYVYYQDPNVI